MRALLVFVFVFQYDRIDSYSTGSQGFGVFHGGGVVASKVDEDPGAMKLEFWEDFHPSKGK